MTADLVNANKDVVRRFNMELIAQGNREAFAEIVAADFVDHSAPPSGSSAAALEHFIFDMLRVAMPDISVDIHDQVAEGDKVMTRKVFRGTFANDLLGLPATNRPMEVSVIDIFVVRDGQVAEHWALHDFALAAQRS